MLMQYWIVMVLLASLLGGTKHREVTFKMHVINADSPYEAAGVLDVNRDGKLDILSGQYWYEGPAWTKHFVREVKEEDNYHYDFGDLPMDVDFDGWTDIVTGAWHNKRLSWIRNPGTSGGKFEEVIIDELGHVETLMLVDVNGDGILDLVPDLSGGMVWYQFKHDPSEKYKAKWIRRGFLKESEGHGVRAGDVNNDGRCDIISPHGWLEQPTDIDAKWPWHKEFELGVASIPILCFDVDGDGDSDIISGMGHDYGLCWLEQRRNAIDQRVWSKHEIDHDWSQAHFLVLGDLDGDNRPELITGKRYYAHNGHDPGGKDPNCIYYYHYEPGKREWRRHTISKGGQAGMGISASLADIDGDGDPDLVAPGKSGLFLFENLCRNK